VSGPQEPVSFHDAGNNRRRSGRVLAKDARSSRHARRRRPEHEGHSRRAQSGCRRIRPRGPRARNAGSAAAHSGESREWDTVEYLADAATEGRHKALIMLSHVPSEQAGMEECARWLKTFLQDTRVEFVPTKDPFASETFSPRR